MTNFSGAPEGEFLSTHSYLQHPGVGVGEGLGDGLGEGLGDGDGLGLGTGVGETAVVLVPEVLPDEVVYVCTDNAKRKETPKKMEAAVNCTKKDVEVLVATAWEVARIFRPLKFFAMQPLYLIGSGADNRNYPLYLPLHKRENNGDSIKNPPAAGGTSIFPFSLLIFSLT